MSILPDPAADGQARRDAALSLLRARRAALVRDLTRAIISIALERGTLTADDVRAAVPIPAGIRPVVVGAAVRDAVCTGILAATGEYVRSRRPEAHARHLPVWRLADRGAALAWLAAHPPIPATD